MGKRKLAQAIGVCIIAISVVVVIIALRTREAAPTRPTLVTYNCTGQRATSLRGQGEVTNIGAGPLSRRGFVWLEGDSGDPAFNITAIPIANPSFEEEEPPTGWTYFQPGVSGNYSRSTEQVRVGTHSLKAVSYDLRNAIITQQVPNWTEYIGKTVTIGAWVWANRRADIMIRWGGFWNVTSSTPHPGDSQWRWMMASRTMRDTDTTLTVMLRAGSGDTLSTTAYFDGVIAFLGNAVFEDGEFGAGMYISTIDLLKPDTPYRVRAFGENTAGIGYGNTVTCRTLAG